MRVPTRSVFKCPISAILSRFTIWVGHRARLSIVWNDNLIVLKNGLYTCYRVELLSFARLLCQLSLLDSNIFRVETVGVEHHCQKLISSSLGISYLSHQLLEALGELTSPPFSLLLLLVLSSRDMSGLYLLEVPYLVSTNQAVQVGQCPT